MKAAIFRQHGAPEVLEYADVPEPQIRAKMDELMATAVMQVKAGT